MFSQIFQISNLDKATNVVQPIILSEDETDVTKDKSLAVTVNKTKEVRK